MRRTVPPFRGSSPARPSRSKFPKKHVFLPSFLPPPLPPSPRLGERVLSCGFFPAEYEIGFLLGPSNDAKFSSLLTLHLLRGQAFPSYLYVGFLSRYNGSSPGVGSGGSHKFSLVGGFDTYSSSSSSEFLHMMELVPLGGLWCCGRSVGRSALGSGGVAQAVL